MQQSYLVHTISKVSEALEQDHCSIVEVLYAAECGVIEACADPTKVDLPAVLWFRHLCVENHDHRRVYILAVLN